jgi:hypothetical protein
MKSAESSLTGEPIRTSIDQCYDPFPVLTRDVRFEGFTHAQWVLLGDAFRPAPVPVASTPGVETPAETAVALPAPRGGVVAVTSGSSLRKLVGTELGRLDPQAEPWPSSLSELAGRHGARWAIHLPLGSLEELADRFAERITREQDFLAQVLELLGVVKELEAERALSVWPWRIAEWPVPSERAVVRALDSLCPNEKAIVLGVFDGGELATCLVARRNGSAFDRLIGPEELRGEMGILSGDFRRDQRHLTAAVERSIAPVALGCFAELSTLKVLAGSREPGAWARAVAAQDVVIAPWMPGVAVPLGVDVGRVALRGLKALAESFGAAHFLSREGPIAQALLGLERPPWLDQDLRAFLGFDPLKLLGRLLSRDLEP